MAEEAGGATTAPSVAPPGWKTGIVVWILLLCIALPAASCVGCLAVGQHRADQGREVAASTIRAISQPWNATAVLKRADEKFSGEVPPEKAERLASWFDRRLGTLQSCDPVTVENWRAFAGTSGLALVATYTADCTFERAKGQVRLTLLRQGSVWKIQGLQVNSDALVE